MAEELTDATATAEPEESFSAFFKNGNAAESARLRGEPLPVEGDVDIDHKPIDEPEVALEAKPDAEPKKKDGRSLEGRRAKQYAEVEAATAARREAERELEATNAQLAERRAELARLAAPPQQQAQRPAEQPAEDREPTIEDFAKEADPYTAWMFARGAYATRQELKRFAAAQSAHYAQQESERAWVGKLTEAEKRTPGLLAKIQSANVQIDTRTVPYIKNHPMGADITGYLIDHPDIAQRLVTLHPVEQIGQIGEIVGQLKAQADAAISGSAPLVKPISHAKPPNQPLGTAPIASSPEPDDDEPLSAYVRRENARDRKAGRL